MVKGPTAGVKVQSRADGPSSWIVPGGLRCVKCRTLGGDGSPRGHPGGATWDRLVTLIPLSGPSVFPNLRAAEG